MLSPRFAAHNSISESSLNSEIRNSKFSGALTIPAERIEKSIIIIRDERVMLDSDLANLYEVSTKVLNQAVSRNRDRFPEDFMFRLTRKEVEELNRSQIVTGMLASNAELARKLDVS